MKLGCITLDSQNAEEHADFYQKLLGWTVRFANIDNGMKFVGIVNEANDVCLLFSEESDYIKPVWPSEQGFVHLDFHTDDLERDVNHAITCGATLAEIQYSNNWRVMLDPAGHPFCIEKLP